MRNDDIEMERMNMTKTIWTKIGLTAGIGAMALGIAHAQAGTLRTSAATAAVVGPSAQRGLHSRAAAGFLMLTDSIFEARMMPFRDEMMQRPSRGADATHLHEDLFDR
jgi:hypothetical protein